MNEIHIPDFGDVPSGQYTLRIFRLNRYQNAKTIVNPDLGPADRRRIEEASLATLRDPANAVIPSNVKTVLNIGNNRYFLGVGGASIAASIMSGVLPLAALGAGMTGVAIAAGSVHQNRVTRRVVSQAGTGYIRSEWLRKELHNPVLGADTNARHIADSLTAKHGMIDKARIEATFPRLVWDIARTLFEVSSLREIIQESGTPSRAQSGALDKVTELMQQRVDAIRECARAVKSADEQYLNLLRIEKLEKSDISSRITDLLARTAVHDMEMAEIKNMSDQARAVASAYRMAVDMALESVNNTLQILK